MARGRGDSFRPGGDPRSARGFPKGVSGNPGGLTKAELALRRLQHELVGDETNGGKEIIAFAVKVLRGKHAKCDDAKSLRWAADFLADRLWGRAPLTVTLRPAARPEVSDLRRMPLEELQRLAAGDPVDQLSGPSDQVDPDAPASGDVH